METFAARYCALNSEVFPSADVAFVLAFSVIMLQTDLHNPAIKEEKKMTKDGFRRNNRGICNGSDLDAQFLDEIFDRIKAAPITLAEDDKLREKEEQASTSVASSMSAAFGLNSDATRRKRAEAFSKEREAMVRSSVQAIGRARGRPRGVPPRQRYRGVQQTVPSEQGRRGRKDVRGRLGPGLEAFSHALERSSTVLGLPPYVARFKNIGAPWRSSSTWPLCRW